MSEKDNIKQWYKTTFPTDELGDEIAPNLTFEDLFRAMDNYKSVYETIAVHDSIVRERIFVRLAMIMEVDYNYVYDQWLLCNK